jgi:REP element-mobilizing transposase RayT
MVIAYHCIFGMYGFWLPNDPRGSGSDYIGSWELFRYGPATRRRSPRSLAHVEHDRAERRAAKLALRFPPVELSGAQARAAVEGFALAAWEGEYAVHACAIMPNHVHLVIGRHARDIRRIVAHLKGRATQTLIQRELWPDDHRPIWGEHSWSVFLNNADSVEHAIAYVEDNPVKEGKRPQKWSFVQEFKVGVALAVKRGNR